MLTIKFTTFDGFTDHSVFDKGTVTVTSGTGNKLTPSATLLDQQLDGHLSRSLKLLKFNGEARQIAHLPAPSGIKADHVFCLGIGDEKNEKDDAQQIIRSAQDLGATIVNRADKEGIKTLHVILDGTQQELAAEFAFGAVLASYRFLNYFTKMKEADKPTLKQLHIHLSEDAVKTAKTEWKRLKTLCEAIYFTRDIVSEPGNVIHPESLAERCKSLFEYGLEITVFNEAKLKKLGFGALLAVGQGSVRESQLVVMNWQGGVKNQAPVALVGKGVTFDTGGISIKPAGGMEDMKWDMGGSAAVIGTMIAAAKRKAKINLVGIVALVENMPDGGAQRPGDIITSLSGQTIEVINTDAEGRLILADALHYAEKEFKPCEIIDLATLTGAILIALGHEYGGLFSNNDTLASALAKAGADTGEKLWQFPMDPAYDRMIRSQIADMRNTGTGRGAGSITAAQFLKRFIENTPWAHLDIAGMAWNNQERPTVPKGASAFGVRLLDHYLRQNHG